MGIYSNLSQEAVAKNKLDRSMILFSINHKMISNLINYRFQWHFSIICITHQFWTVPAGREPNCFAVALAQAQA